VIGNDALYQACYAGHTKIVKILLQDPRTKLTARDHSAVEVARQQGHHEIVELLSPALRTVDTDVHS